MRRGGLVLLCLLAFVAGEGGVLLKQWPVGYAVVVAVVSLGLGWVSLWKGGVTSPSASDASSEQFIEEMKGLCPWMTWEDVVLLRRAFVSVTMGWHDDLSVVADAALHLFERARATGDERRAWVFWQRYLEVCAWQQGQEYTWPALPQELEEV